MEEQKKVNATVPVMGEIINDPYGKNMLSLTVAFDTYGEECSYSYTVFGRTEDTNFTYESETYEVNPVIPVIGLYGSRDTEIEIVLTSSEGIAFTPYTITSTYWQDLDFGDHPLTITVESLEDGGADLIMKDAWLFNSYIDAYDKNGDLRVCGLSSTLWKLSPMKSIQNGIVIPTDEVYHYYNDKYEVYSLTGKLLNAFTAPEGLGFHHDITQDNDGNVYILGSYLAEGQNHAKIEGHVHKYTADGTLLNTIDYTDLYYQSSVLRDSAANDVHFNTIFYVKETDQIIVNSRGCSNYMFIDKHTLLPIWSVDNPAHKRILPDFSNLSVVNPEEFIYTNGEHSVGVTYNKKYESYRQEGKLVLSIFDNVACKDEEGNDLEIVSEEASTEEDAGYLWDSAIQVVAIDLNNRSVEQLDRWTIPGVRSEFICNVFDTQDKEHFQIQFGTPGFFYVIDSNGTPILRVPEFHGYRASLFTLDQIRNMVS